MVVTKYIITLAVELYVNTFMIGIEALSDHTVKARNRKAYE